MKLENTIFSRHTERADGAMGLSPEKKDNISERYPSLSKEGERKAGEMADQEFAEMVDDMKDGGILFIGGSSEEDRTKETAEVVGDKLKEKYREDKNIIVFTREEIDSWRDEAKEENGKVLDRVRELIASNPDKKIIFDYPLFLKEFSLRPHGRDPKTGEHTPYMKALLEKVDYSEREGAFEWFKNNGRIAAGDETLEIPGPQETAETHIRGIERLKEFARKIVGDRGISIGFIGHGWQLDALAVYLANNGKASVEAYEEEFGAEPIRQPEAGRVVVDADKAVFRYRGKEYEIK